MKTYKEIIRIDRLLNIDEVDQKNYIHLQKLLYSNSARNYFWNNLDNNKWFKILLANDGFDLLDKNSKDDNEVYVTQVHISNYLLKIAGSFPEQIVHLLITINCNNPRVLWDFVEIGKIIPAEFTAKLVPYVKNWIKVEHLSSTNFAPEITCWFDKLIKGEQLDAALLLLEILSTPKKQEPNKEIDKEYEELFGKENAKAIPVLEHYWMQKMFSEGIRELIENEPLKAAMILGESLEKAVDIEYGHNQGYDLSYIWRAAIEDHSQNYERYDFKETLLVALRTAMEKTTMVSSDDAKKIINEYLANKYSIFRRLGFHLLRINIEQYSSIIKKLVKKKRLYRNHFIEHEFYLLLGDAYPMLSDEYKKFIINTIRSYKSFDKKAKPEIQEKQKKFYWYEKLNFLKDHLKGEELRFFNELRNEFKDETVRDTTVWHESYSGERTPKETEELAVFEISALWDYLKSYRPSGRGLDNPSIEGLAMSFSGVVKNDPEKFLTNDLTPLIELFPTYSFWFFEQIAGLLKQGKLIENPIYIESILSIANKVIRIQDLPDQLLNEDYNRINFVGVKRRILEVIRAFIVTNRNSFPLTYQDQIWEIIEYLCFYNEDPTDSIDNLQNEEGWDPVTLAINSVRSLAVHSLIDFALWYAYHTKDRFENVKYPNRLEEEDRVLKLLERKLKNKEEDKSLAIHSSFGMFLAKLAYLNLTWVKQSIKNIFPEDEKQKLYWETAWSSYITYARFYTVLFTDNILKPQYKKAVLKYESGEKLLTSGVGKSAEISLFEHLIAACIWEKEDIFKRNSLIRRITKCAGSEEAVHSVQFIANIAKDENIFVTKPHFWEQAKEFWKLRINAVKNTPRTIEKEEDKIDTEFSRYIYWLDDLPKSVTIDEIKPLLRQTIKLNKRGWHLPNFIEYLVTQSENSPGTVIELFDELINTDAPSYFYHGKEESTELILKRALETQNKRYVNAADRIMNKFGVWGNYYFKDMWENNFLPKITIENISEKDAQNHRIRVLVKQKPHFPKEIIGEPKEYPLKIKFDDEFLDAVYKIGSQDGKSRSGRLCFRRKDFAEKLKIKEKATITIIVLVKNRMYKIVTSE